MKPLVSVIIPFLNPGEWLTEAIDSVLSQSYFKWEIILIDDGSIEKDSVLAKSYSLRYPEKIKYIEHPGHINKGLTASRNYGISFSKGEYISFLDADDYWLPEKLSNQVELFNLFPEAAMICEASRFWYSWNDKNKEDIHVNVGAEPGLYQPCELTKKLYPIGIEQPPCPSGIIIKERHCIEGVDLKNHSQVFINSMKTRLSLLKYIYLKRFMFPVQLIIYTEREPIQCPAR